MRVNYCLVIIGPPHAGCSHRVKDRSANISGELGQFVVGLVLKAWFEFLGLVLLESRLFGNTARHPQRVGSHFSVFRRTQVIRRNGRRLLWVVTADAHGAPAGGVQVANAGGDGREIVKWLAECVQAQGLNVVFDVGVFVLLGAAGEQAQL